MKVRKVRNGWKRIVETAKVSLGKVYSVMSSSDAAQAQTLKRV